MVAKDVKEALSDFYKLGTHSKHINKQTGKLYTHAEAKRLGLIRQNAEGGLVEHLRYIASGDAQKDINWGTPTSEKGKRLRSDLKIGDQKIIDQLNNEKIQSLYIQDPDEDAVAFNFNNSLKIQSNEGPNTAITGGGEEVNIPPAQNPTIASTDATTKKDEAVISAKAESPVLAMSDIKQIKGLNQRDLETRRYLESRGYSLESIAKHDMREFLRDARIGHANEFSGSKGTFLHSKYGNPIERTVKNNNITSMQIPRNQQVGDFNLGSSNQIA